MKIQLPMQETQEMLDISLGGEDPLHQGNGNPLQYSCLENPMDRGAWQATVHGVARVRHDLATKPPWPYLNGLVVFPTFFNLSLNFAIKELTIRATQ